MVNVRLQPRDVQTRLGQLLFVIERLHAGVDVLAAERVQAMFVGIHEG